MFSGSDGIPTGSVHNNDTARRCRGHVDVVDADPCPSNHLEPIGLLQDLGPDLGSAADRESVEFPDKPRQGLWIIGRFVVVHHDFDSSCLLHDLLGTGRHVVPNHYPKHMELHWKVFVFVPYLYSFG